MKNLRSLSPSIRSKTSQKAKNSVLFKSINKAIGIPEMPTDSSSHNQFSSKHMSTSEIPFLKCFNKKSDEHGKLAAFANEINDIYNQRSFIQNSAGLIQKDLEEFYSLVNVPADNIKSTENLKHSKTNLNSLIRHTECDKDTKSSGVISSLCGLPKVFQNRK